MSGTSPGVRPEDVTSRGALADPASLDPFFALATSGAPSGRSRS